MIQKFQNDLIYRLFRAINVYVKREAVNMAMVYIGIEKNIIYKIQRNYSKTELETIAKKIEEQMRFVEYLSEQNYFKCANKLTADMIFALFRDKIF